MWYIFEYNLHSQKMTRIKLTYRCPKGLTLNYVQQQAPQPPTSSESEGSDDTKGTRNDITANIESMHEEPTNENNQNQ